MAKKANDSEALDIQIVEIRQGTVTIAVVGDAPLVLNRLAEKARQQLLFPSGRKNAAEKATSMKHNPIEEFRSSAHILESGPTLLAMPGVAFKRAMASAALELPGTKKAQIGRLTYLPAEKVAIYGVPELYMAVVRSAGMDRTPDIRTRCIVPKWAAIFDVKFVIPTLSIGAVVNLFSAAGVYIGVGDGRVEKGAMSFGRFHTVPETAPELEEIIVNGGRDKQLAAMEHPGFYDAETEELFTWFESEKPRREYMRPARGKNGAGVVEAPEVEEVAHEQ